MKFYLLPAMLILFVTSCQKPKDWNCTCDYSALSGSGTKSITITNKIQRDANEECTSFGQKLIGGNGNYKCKLTVK